MDSDQEEGLAVSATEIIVDSQHNRPLLLHDRRRQMTEEDLAKGSAPRSSSPSGRKNQRPCKNYLKKGNCTNPSCHHWPPVCQNYKSESGCKFGEKCVFRHTELDSQPCKKSKKSCGKGSVASLKKSNTCGLTEQPKSKSILRKSTKSLESSRTVRNPPSRLGSPPKVNMGSFLGPSLWSQWSPISKRRFRETGFFSLVWAFVRSKKSESLKYTKIRETPNGSTENACCVKHGCTRMCFSLEEEWPRGPFLGFREVKMGPGTF